jgi:hypothetical protein
MDLPPGYRPTEKTRPADVPEKRPSEEAGDADAA